MRTLGSNIGSFGRVERTVGDGNGRVRRKWRLGVVSFLNAKPLIAGLDAAEDIELFYAVPSRLSALLDAGVVDVALVPVIDWARNEHRWQIVSDGCIGCDGETLTVRVFSRVPPSEVITLRVDGDSHTSVALAAITWKKLYGRLLRIMPLNDLAQTCNEVRGIAPRGLRPAARTGCTITHRHSRDGEGTADSEAVLLIGDKVVRSKPGGYDIQTDLGAAWKLLTSLPFVFAVWAAPREVDATELTQRLNRARDLGVASARQIAARFAPLHGWPVTLAEEYLTARLRFTLGPGERQGMAKFIELARANHLISASLEEPALA